jgi:hypothetical protein
MFMFSMASENRFNVPGKLASIAIHDERVTLMGVARMTVIHHGNTARALRSGPHARCIPDCFQLPDRIL